MDIEIREFTQAIGAVTPPQGSEHYATFRSIFRRSNYFLLAGKFLMVKISRSANPFWGIGKDFVDLLNDVDYFLVLLVSNREGWVFAKAEVNSNINSNRWRLREADRNYKIHMPLPDRNSFHSHQSFLEKIGL